MLYILCIIFNLFFGATIDVEEFAKDANFQEKASGVIVSIESDPGKNTSTITLTSGQVVVIDCAGL